MRVFSYGGGVQSNAVLVLQKRGVVHYDAFLFCNVGEDSENPATLDYVNRIARPYAEKNGIPFYELQNVKRDGTVMTIWQKAMAKNRTVPIPAFLQSGAPGNRTCTVDFKINVVAKWTRRNGATKDNPAIVGLGISLDEYQRMRTDSGIPHERLEYPLIDLRLTRSDCRRLIVEEGLPTPQKSSCFFCPYHSLETWRNMEANEPELFRKACELEKRVNEKRVNEKRVNDLKKDEVYLTRFLRPLSEVVQGYQTLPFEEATCESGYCMV